MGLRYPEAMIEDLKQGVLNMALNFKEESVTYKIILNEGRADEARRLLLRMGRRRFGEPAPEVLATIEAMKDLDRIEDLAERLLDVTSWDELLAVP
jgi:hypothetical protein